LNSLSDVSVVIPAAGMGVRMAAGKPKQYLELLGKTILEHTISRLAVLGPRHLIVAVSPDDEYYKTLTVADTVKFINGGSERADSVLKGLEHLNLGEHDWVMVHDAVRPCVRREDILSLCEAVKESDVGGLLGIQVTDTLKRVTKNASDRKVVHTIDRSELWRAQTPQMFRYGLLKRALQLDTSPTDEASAIEQLGLQPLMVTGHFDNIKITTSEDLNLAAYYLSLHSNTVSQGTLEGAVR
jgi:2-C-methyl-D-erythritol 4-phosphate cytidylyltransferase